MEKFKDNATTKIIAWDFDNTLTDSDIFPRIGKPRKYAKEVMNFLHSLGVTNLIWTCRDTHGEHDDITPMREWLDGHGFRYNDVNTCIEYAPFHYEARKIYAHMYVDDKGFGWDNNNEFMLLIVLNRFLQHHMGYDAKDARMVMNGIIRDTEYSQAYNDGGKR